MPALYCPAPLAAFKLFLITRSPAHHHHSVHATDPPERDLCNCGRNTPTCQVLHPKGVQGTHTWGTLPPSNTSLKYTWPRIFLKAFHAPPPPCGLLYPCLTPPSQSTTIPVACQPQIILCVPQSPLIPHVKPFCMSERLVSGKKFGPAEAAKLEGDFFVCKWSQMNPGHIGSFFPRF